jgi:hypothetical protein
MYEPLLSYYRRPRAPRPEKTPKPPGAPGQLAIYKHPGERVALRVGEAVCYLRVEVVSDQRVRLLLDADQAVEVFFRPELLPPGLLRPPAA